MSISRKSPASRVVRMTDKNSVNRLPAARAAKLNRSRRLLSLPARIARARGERARAQKAWEAAFHGYAGAVVQDLLTAEDLRALGLPVLEEASLHADSGA